MLKQNKTFGIRMFAFILGMLLPLCVYAQKINVSGVVKDAVGGVPGASIIEKGTTNGAIADVDGQFTLTVAPGAVLEVSCIGYLSVEVPAGDGRSSIQITLSEDTELLEEVLVIGYGTIRKSDLTGAVSAVNSKDLKVPICTFKR